MANTRNSQKRENDDAPAAADSKDSSDAEPTISDLFRLIEDLRSQGEATKTDLQSEMRSNAQSLRSVFDERLDKIESTSEQHEEAFLSFSTRLNRIENQLAEQNMQHDNNQNLNDNNQNISGNDVNNSYQNVNNNNPNVNINNQNEFFNHGGGLPARIRFQQHLAPMEDLSVSHAQGQPPQPHATPQLSQPIPRVHSEVIPLLQMKAIKRVVEDESRGIRPQDDEIFLSSNKAECKGLDLVGSVTYIRTNYTKSQGGIPYEILGDDIPPDKANALKLHINEVT